MGDYKLMDNNVLIIKDKNGAINSIFINDNKINGVKEAHINASYTPNSTVEEVTITFYSDSVTFQVID